MYQGPANSSILVSKGERLVGDCGMQLPQQQQPQQQRAIANSITTKRKKPFIKIIEQPASKGLRFRYECEGRSAGSIPGANSTVNNKTYPTIEIVGYKGRAVVVVSCVTKDPPYRSHPHNLVGKEGCRKGVCTMEINPETMTAVFSNLGIQCVKKKDIEASLKAREDIRVDPFKTGFTHRSQPSSIDLNSVRLCFQVFMEGAENGRFEQPLAPVISEPIFDKKAMSDLVICRLCSCSGTVLGNSQIILLCEKVAKDDISVRFFEEKNKQTIWEAFGEFQPSDVHKQTAISFKTPRYHKIDITEGAKVFIQLKRPSDGITSEALPFEYIPLDSDPAHLKRKRQKTNGDPIQFLLQHQRNQRQYDYQDGRQQNYWNGTNIPEIKTEPTDACSLTIANQRPPELTPSASPSHGYTHNAASSYSMSRIVPAGEQCNQQLISQKPQYNTTNIVAVNNTPPLIHCNAYGKDTPHEQYLRHDYGCTDATNWVTKYNADLAAGNNYINHAHITNAFTMQNRLMPPNSAGTQLNDASGTSWNLTYNNFQQQSHQHLQMQQSHVHQQHQIQSQRVTNNNNESFCNIAFPDTTISNVNNNEDGLSTLLTFDSEQLIRINSEDQKMLRLNSEDLQISNLSISA